MDDCPCDKKWAESSWGKFVLAKIASIERDQKEDYAVLSALNVKATIWGLFGGLIPVLILVAVEIFSTKSPF